VTTPLSQLTTLRVGGAARELVFAHTREQLIAAVREAWASLEPLFILGGGSNTVFSDDGFDGTVIAVRTRGMEVVEAQPGASAGDDAVLVRVAAGELWDDVVAWAVLHELAGIEALSGIPGSAGAAPIQNIGAYGQELSQCLTAVEFLDTTTGEISWMPVHELALGYRTSVFKQGRAGVILAIELRLTRSSLSQPLAFSQLATALGAALGDRLPLHLVRSTVLALRASKGMVVQAPDAQPIDHDTWSVGSFFMNPVVTENFARGLPEGAPVFPLEPAPAERVLPLGADVPPLAGPALVKLSAAWLIEQAGVRKGFQVPGSGAGISTKHTLAITNRGTATANDVLGLAHYVQAMVQSHFGIVLRPEANLVGLEL
jgi:UDP-N-acetylmuramate dehydrogenase